MSLRSVKNPSQYLVIARLIFYLTALTASIAFIFLFPALGIFDEERTRIIAIPVSMTALTGDLIVFYLLERLFRQLQRAAKIENYNDRILSLMRAKKRIMTYYFPLVYIVVLAAAVNGVITLVLERYDVFSTILGATIASIAYILNLHLPAFFTINYLLELYISRFINAELLSVQWKELSPETLDSLKNFSFRQRHAVIGIAMPLMLFTIIFTMVLNVKTLTITNYLTLGFFFLLYLLTLQLYFFQTNETLQDFVNALKTISLGETEQTVFQPLSIKSSDDIAQAAGHYNNIILKLRKSMTTQSRVASQLQDMVLEYQTQFANLNKLANGIATASTNFASIMQENAEKSSEMAKRMEEVRSTLEDFSRRIEELTTNVEDTAEQVRILSFNAQLEAVRVTTSASAAAFMTISQAINDLYHEVEENDTMIKELVDEFKEHVVRMISSISEVAAESNRNSELALAQTQEINASIEEETALIEELHAQTEQLSDLSKELEELITLFSKTS